MIKRTFLYQTLERIIVETLRGRTHGTADGKSSLEDLVNTIRHNMEQGWEPELEDDLTEFEKKLVNFCSY